MAEYWRPRYIVEQGSDGNCVLFLPDIPETNKKRILLAYDNHVRIV
jgi:hypothetical protein